MHHNKLIISAIGAEANKALDFGLSDRVFSFVGFLINKFYL